MAVNNEKRKCREWGERQREEREKEGEKALFCFNSGC